jgi:hypothetical protein
MKKVYYCEATPSDWNNNELLDNVFYLNEKITFCGKNKKVAVSYFKARFDFLKNNWCKEMFDELKKLYRHETIIATLYQIKVPDNFSLDYDNPLDYDIGGDSCIVLERRTFF